MYFIGFPHIFYWCDFTGFSWVVHTYKPMSLLIPGFFIGTLYSFHRYFITHEKYQLQLSWVFQGDHGNSMVIARIYCPVVFSPNSSVSVPFILMGDYRSVHHALETFFQRLSYKCYIVHTFWQQSWLVWLGNHT